MSFRTLIYRRGFRPFLWAQFLAAFNDNTYRMLVSLRAVHIAARGGTDYLSLAGAIFVVPFLLFSGYSGHLADRFSKRTVLISVKAFEVLVMALGCLTFFCSRIELMLLVLFLMALHSTIFSPAKYGIVPEMLPAESLSRANALIEMSTFVAIVSGTASGSVVFAVWRDQPWRMGLITLALACIGLLASFRIPRVSAAGAEEPLLWNPFGEILAGTRHLLRVRPLWLTVSGISYFWFLGALLQMSTLLFGCEVLKVNDLQAGILLTCLGLGIGGGSMLVGKLSEDKVELGWVPIGSFSMGLLCAALWMVRGSYLASAAVLAGIGITGGFFIVPLNAYLQARSGRKEKGRMQATNNFYNTIGVLSACGAFWLFHDRLGMPPDILLLGLGGLTLLVTLLLMALEPTFLISRMLWIILRALFRAKVAGTKNIPLRGPALLVANHVTRADGFLIAACVPRLIRFMVWKPYYEAPLINRLFSCIKAIPIGTNGPRDVLASIRLAREELRNGNLVCIFAEGSVTRIGNLLPFKRGMEKIVEGLDVPIVPIYLDGLWGRVLSFSGEKSFWKRPRRSTHPVTISFGSPLAPHSAAEDVRLAVQALGSDAVARRKTSDDVLPLRFARIARKQWSRLCMADSTGRELTYGGALTASVLIAGWLREHSLEQKIGVLLPASVGGALANTGIGWCGKVPVNLNFTAGTAAMASAIRQCNIETILTSRTFLQKAKLNAPVGAVFLEDLLARFGRTQKLAALLQARLVPARRLLQRLAGADLAPDSLATVIFSSGSTGDPKGVMLSHYNIISNIEAMVQVFRVSADDRVIGVLPFFHSFGFTVTLWFPLLAGCGVAFHPNPTDADAVGALISKYRGSFLLSTPTFCGGYIRKCTKAEFASLRYVLVGAEPLRQSFAKAFEEKFGKELLEGYGCTEMAPAIAVNTPGFVNGKDLQLGKRSGTVGLPLPGVTVQAVDPDTLLPRRANEEGLLLAKGPNRMLGYLGQPELTRAVIRDGWYITGDIGSVDDQGFVRIAGRVSRFSKIGGEMVPHLMVEEAVSSVIGEDACAVTGVPDDQRGERLMVFYTCAEIKPSELWRQLCKTDLPRLWVPKREDIHLVDSLPMLGTGKLDLRELAKRASTLGPPSARPAARDPTGIALRAP
ncbi:MAG: acyl-[ACP]--phospholipid O-acyltransferase [Acidobacteriota bacterium]